MNGVTCPLSPPPIRTSGSRPRAPVPETSPRGALGAGPRAGPCTVRSDDRRSRALRFRAGDDRPLSRRPPLLRVEHAGREYRVRAWKLTAAAVLLAAAIPTTVWAQASPPVVVPGGSVVLDRQQAALAVTRVARGTAGFVPSKAAPAVNQLVYVAPDTPGDDTVEYTVGGTEKKSVTVSVRQAAPDFTSPELYGKSFAALFMLFIMAVLVENGLAVLFHWRPFLVTLDPKSVNPLVSFGLSLVFVRLFHQDIVSGLLNIYSGKIINLPCFI